MESYGDMRIDDAFVIHVLDNRMASAQCSQALTPLPDTFRAILQRYLAALFTPACRRKRFGRFRDDAPVRQAYRHLVRRANGSPLIDPTVFLDVSQRLAVLLFEAMRQAPQNGARKPGDITPGDLHVGVVHRQESVGLTEPWLFLIKVELETRLQRQLRTLPQGGVQTVLTPCEGLLPRLTAEHVHKTALIRCSDDVTTYEVLMTDPQGGRQGVARFFAEDFLQTEPFHTPDEQAELLFMRTHTWVTDHEEELSPKEQQDVLESVRTLITERAAQAEPLAPRDLVMTLPLSEAREEPVVRELRRSFQETLTASEANGDSMQPESELLVQTVPPPVARTRVTYLLDHGVQLSGDREAIERLFATPPHRVDDNTEFTIRTKMFRPLL
jgi:hypothetical protein